MFFHASPRFQTFKIKRLFRLSLSKWSGKLLVLPKLRDFISSLEKKRDFSRRRYFDLSTQKFDWWKSRDQSLQEIGRSSSPLQSRSWTFLPSRLKCSTNRRRSTCSCRQSSFILSERALRKEKYFFYNYCLYKFLVFYYLIYFLERFFLYKLQI